MSAVIWIHFDAISRDHPVFDAAPEDARPLYIWDADDLARREWSLKRCVFVLECLQDMQADIVCGTPVKALDDLGATQIFTATTPDLALKQAIADLGDRVQLVDPPIFAAVPNGADMGRFFRYWNSAKRSALRKN